MKILIVDPLSYVGHINYNAGVIRGIAGIADYSIIVSDHMKAELIHTGIDENRFLPSYPDHWNITELAKKHRSKIAYHVLFRKYFLRVVNRARQEGKKYDMILFLCIDIFSFFPLSFLFGSKCAVVDHGIGYIQTSRVYNTAWKCCSHKIKLIVLEDFIRDMMKKEDPRRLAYTVRHPLPAKAADVPVSDDQKIYVFAPGASNNQGFIDKALEASIPQDIQLIIKGKTEVNREGIHIYSGRMSEEDYGKNLARASFILLPYDPDYNYRTSAVLFEAALQGKPVLIWNNNTLSYYKSVFGDNVYLFDTVEEMLEIIRNHSQDKHCGYDLDQYTDEGIGQAILKVYEGR